jgi:dolichol-phosphate mannosyltransferase
MAATTSAPGFEPHARAPGAAVERGAAPEYDAPIHQEQSESDHDHAGAPLDGGPGSPSGDRERTLTFVIPFWNEEAGGDRCLHAIRAAADRMSASGQLTEVRIVAVDDGSTDGTAAILDRHAAEDPRVQVVRHPVNRGLGAGLHSGLAAVTTAWAFYTDADLPVDPEAVLAALDRAEATGAPVVSCYRTGHRREGWHRPVLTRGYNLAVRLVVGLRVRDVNAPAKLIHRSVIEAALPQVVSPFCDAELLARARRSGAAIEQIGVQVHPRTAGSSSLSSPQVIAATLADLVRHGPALRTRRGQTASMSASSAPASSATRK